MSEELPASEPTDPSGPEAPLPPAVVAGQLLATARAVRARRARRKSGRRLFNFGLGGTAVALGYLSYKANLADPSHLYLGQAIFILAVLPSLMWAKRAEFGLPLFEAFMITGVNTYAIPLLDGARSLHLYTSDTITTAALAVILFQAAANLTYFSVKAPPKRSRTWRTEIVSRDFARLIGYGMIVTTIYTVVVQFYDWIPNSITPEVRAVCYGIGIVATFVQSRRWGEGDLNRRDRTIFLVQLVLQVAFSWVALFLVQGVTILLLSLIGFVSGSRRVPLLPIFIVLPIIAILYQGKAMMRAKYWEAHYPAPTLTEVPAFFTEWVSDGLDMQAQAAQDKANVSVLDRTSLIQIICLVASISPDRKPFLDGETYTQILPQFVPRFFWKDKPLGHISTYTLSLYYGLQQTMAEAQETTIGFGMVSESYANFGFYGTCLLGLFFGLFFKKVTGWGSESPIFSYPGLFMVVLMAWTFQTELPLSAWLASLWQATLSVLGMPLILKNFFQ